MTKIIDGLERLGSVVVEETDVSEKSKPNTCTLCKLDFNFVIISSTSEVLLLWMSQGL